MIIRRLPLAFLVSFAFFATACGGSADETTSDSGSSGRGSVTGEFADEAQADSAEAEPTDDEDGGGFAGAQDPGELPGEQPLPQQASARSGERIIKDGTMTIEVAEGGFVTAYRRVIDTARDLGGYLTESTSSNMRDGGTSGSVTVRVPVDSYEDLLTRVGQVGTLRGQQITSRDVTAEFTDLGSRLRHLRAQESFYLGLLEDAEGVQDTIAVKQQLDGIQSQIEQAQGRLNVLEDRTSFSTLTVEIIEPGAEPVVLAAGQRPALAEYWATARDGFVTVVGWLLVSVVSLAPLLVPLLLAGAVWRLSRRRPEAVATVSGDAN